MTYSICRSFWKHWHRQSRHRYISRLLWERIVGRLWIVYEFDEHVCRRTIDDLFEAQLCVEDVEYSNIFVPLSLIDKHYVGGHFRKLKDLFVKENSYTRKIFWIYFRETFKHDIWSCIYHTILSYLPYGCKSDDRPKLLGCDCYRWTVKFCDYLENKWRSYE